MTRRNSVLATVTHAAASGLARLAKLKELDVSKTKSTPAGLARLRKSLPKAKITPAGP